MNRNNEISLRLIALDHLGVIAARLRQDGIVSMERDHDELINILAQVMMRNKILFLKQFSNYSSEQFSIVCNVVYFFQHHLYDLYTCIYIPILTKNVFTAICDTHRHLITDTYIFRKSILVSLTLKYIYSLTVMKV